MKKCLIVFYIFLAVSLFAQMSSVEYVSNLVARKVDNKIVLTWQNPTDFNNILEVYRADELISSTSTLENALLLTELFDGEEEFVDDRPDEGNNFYAVMVRNRVGDVQNLVFISFKNYTFAPIRIDKPTARLTSLKVSTSGNKVKIVWNYKSKDDYNINVSIYRAFVPIKTVNEMNKSIKIANIPISNKTFVDAVVPNINYYYAVVVEDQVEPKFAAGVTMTDKPVYIVDTQRNENFDINTFIPLPLLTFRTDPMTGKPLDDPFAYRVPKMSLLSAKSSSLHEQFVSDNLDVISYLSEYRGSNLIDKDVVMLPDEKYYHPNEFNIQYKLALKLIGQHNYLDALNTLSDLTSQMLNSSMRDRVLYYYAAVLFKQKDYNNAYINFNLAATTFHAQCKPYLTATAFEIYKSLDK